MSNPAFQMAGTEGSFQYVVVALGTEGRIGFRPLGDMARVRIEPKDGASYGVVRRMDEELQGSDFEWKTPNGQFRFSTVIDGNEGLREALEVGIGVIGEIEQVNPAAPAWARRLAGEYVPEPAPVAAKAESCGLNEDLVKALLASMQALAAALVKK
jgi:hypothetical protein